MTKRCGRAVKTAYWLAAVLLFVLLFLCFGCRKPENADAAALDVVFMGDSIFAQPRSDTAIPLLVSAKTGRATINCAIGGTLLSRGRTGMEMEVGDVRIAESAKRVLCMTSMVQAMRNNDFSAQQAISSREDVLSYQPYTVDTLASIDFSKVNTLIFNHGINDYHQGVRLDNPEDEFDIYTYGGALRQILKQLQEGYPELRIIYVTPLYSWYGEEWVSCEEQDFGQGSLSGYVNLALDICAEYGVECVDLYHELYDFADWAEHPGGSDAAEADEHPAERYTVDGVHPNEATRERIAELLAECLEQ